MEKSQEELEQLLDALRQGKLKGHEIYRAVQAFGENNFQVARPEVEALLQSDDFELRFVALKVLTGYWHLAEHWETAYQVLLHDPEVECRFRAATDLGSLKRNTQDARTLNVLAHIVCNEQEELVLHYDPKEQWHIASRKFDLATGVDWEMVKRYCKINENT